MPEGPEGGLASFETDPEPTEPQPEERSEPWLDETRGTVLGVVLAALVAGATIFVARQLLAAAGLAPGIGETVSVGLIAFLVALGGFVPLRWGLWVVPLVAGAHYALNFYNMLFTDGSVYEFVQGDAMGYAVLTPAIGVVLGWALEGVYRLVAPS